MNSELTRECPSEADLQILHALDLASENQWLRVLQSNRILVDSIIFIFYYDARRLASSNADYAKGS